MEKQKLQAHRAARPRILQRLRLGARSKKGGESDLPTQSRSWHRWRFGLLGVIGPVILLAGTSWMLTADLEPPANPDLNPWPAADEAQATIAKDQAESTDWPADRLEGQAAKERLLRILVDARERLKAVSGYTCILRRQERLNGRLGPEQTIAMKVRHQPFGVYLRFLEPEEGREAVYHEGRYDDCVIAHPGGLGRAFLPRLKVPPDSKLALAGNRHPITEAGILNLTEKLVSFREMDLTDDEATTVLDRFTDEEGRHWFRSVHDHPNYQPERPFQYVEVFYDPQTKFPVRIISFDWPEPGHTGPRKLAERYFYDDLELNAPLSDLDFDPANPDYEFKRF